MNTPNTTKQTHTPGPWTTKPAHLNIKDPLFYKADVISGGMIVAHVAGVGEDNSNANARLIASSPTLLDLCQRSIAMWDQYINNSGDNDIDLLEYLKELKQEVRKAEGA